MSMSEEKLQILKMVEEKKITAAEAAELLEALENGSEDLQINKKMKAKWLRVKVLADDGEIKANVNIPLLLVDVGLKIGKKLEPKLKDDLSGIDIEEILDLIKQGAEGKIIDVYDENSKINAEIYVE